VGSGTRLKRILLFSAGEQARKSVLYVGGKDLALFTSAYFFGPTPMNFPLTTGAADKPAEVPDLKFPRRAFFPVLQTTALHVPAGAEVLRSFFQGQQKEQLPFHMGRYPAPPLLETLDRPEGNSQQLGHLLLRLLEPLAKQRKFFGVHGPPPEKNYFAGKFFP
jgi:hypothetical protein